MQLYNEIKKKKKNVVNNEVGKNNEKKMNDLTLLVTVHRGEVELGHANVDFISYYGVVWCFKVYE
jgi:hypothetical protein